MNKYLPWFIGLLIIISATIIIIIVIDGHGKTKVYCGPGKTNPVFVDDNPEKSFPAFATEYSIQLESGVSFLDTLTKAASIAGSAGSEIKTDVVELREKLNQENIRMENLLRSYYVAYNYRPCDPEVSRRYFNFIDTLSFRITELEKLKYALTNSNVNTSRSDSTVTSKEIIKDTAKVKAVLKHLKNVLLPPKIISFTVDNDSVTIGETVKFTWSTAEANDIRIDRLRDTRLMKSGEIEVPVRRTLTYTLTARNANNRSVSKEITVTALKKLVGLYIEFYTGSYVPQIGAPEFDIVFYDSKNNVFCHNRMARSTFRILKGTGFLPLPLKEVTFKELISGGRILFTNMEKKPMDVAFKLRFVFNDNTDGFFPRDGDVCNGKPVWNQMCEQLLIGTADITIPISLR